MLAEADTCFAITASGAEKPSDTSVRCRLLWIIVLSMTIRVVFERAILLTLREIVHSLHNDRCNICNTITFSGSYLVVFQ